MHRKKIIIYSLLVCMLSGTIMPISAQDRHVSPTVPEEDGRIMVVERINGSFEQEVFFAGKDAGYEFQVSGPGYGKEEASIIVKIGEEQQQVPVSTEGVAELPIKPGQEGYMEIFYDGDREITEEEDADEVLQDYIIAEEIPPIVSCAKLEGSSGEEMVISLRDDGEIVSGIRSYKVLLDGEELKDYTEVKTEEKLQNGATIYNKVEITISAGVQDGQELSVAVEDQCGNLTQKSIPLGEIEEKGLQDGKEQKERKEGKEAPADDPADDTQESADDVFVIVPTDITMKLFTGPNMVEGNIQSQDIMVINKSQFPVRVTVSQVRYEVKDGREEIPCELSAIVRRYKKGEQVYDLRKKDNAPFSLELAAGRKETDAQGLLNKAAKWNPTGSVQSPDYGVLRLEGTTEQSGKASVGVVFEFEKIDDGQ